MQSVSKGGGCGVPEGRGAVGGRSGEVMRESDKGRRMVLRIA